MVKRGPVFRRDPACEEADPTLFDTDGRGAEGAWKTRQALAICAQCPIRIKQACLEAALHGGERGIWGGTTEPERARMRTGGVVELGEVA